jgi:glycosyltransferase involved in cell wall biosynthesis
MPPPEGGMANQCRQLASFLSGESVDVLVVRTNAPYQPAWLGRIRFVRAPARLLPYLFHLWRGIGRADVVHIFANSGWAWHLFAAPAIWISRLRRRPVVINYRGGGAEEFLKHAPGFVVRTMASASSLITPSGYLRAVFAKVGLPAQIIPNIIDLERFRPADQPRSPRTAHIVVTRNLEKIYDIQAAICALGLLRAHLPHARLTIAGAGPERAGLEAMVTSLSLGDAVTFTGRIDNAQIADLYRSADVMLNPSLVDNMPISVLEAFASGVVVVSTNVGGVPHVAEDGRTALLIPPGDAAAAAEALRKVLTDGPLARRLTAAALIEVQAYSWERVRDQWLGEYYTRSRVHHEPTMASNDGGVKGSSPPPG